MISLAQKLAEKSVCRTKHGAVVSKGARVFGRGYNSYKPHPTYGGGPLMTLHAEAAAIRDAKRRGICLRGATIFVARVGNNSNMSKPCKSCQEMIGQEGIRKVVYTDEHGHSVSEWPLEGL